MGRVPGDLRAFGFNADLWTTAAQDEGERRKTVEQGRGETFHAGKRGRCRESQGLTTTACGSMPKRDGKDR